MAGVLNPENFYQIKAFRGNDKDRELIKLGHFLMNISQTHDVKPLQYHRKIF